MFDNFMLTIVGGVAVTLAFVFVMLLVVRGLQMRVIASLVAVVVFLAVYAVVLRTEPNAWLALALAGIPSLGIFVGLRMYYRIFKSTGRFPDIRW